MNYHNKYIKYKKKYVNLKYNNHQYGGGADDIAQILESLNNLNCTLIGTTPVEMIFILADKTSQFAKEINSRIMTVITSDEMYIAAQDTLLQAHSVNLLGKFSNLFKLVESPSHSLENWTNGDINNDLYKLLKKFIDRYIQLEIFIGKTDLDISIEFAKLFDNIKLMLTGLYANDNVIDEYLLFNLLSIFFLDYEVEFTNYYTDFNKINYKDCIGIIVNTSNEKLCLFIHKTNLISYSYTTKRFFSTDNSTLNNNILHITQEGKLIDEITYEFGLTEEARAKCSKVMYITVIIKSTNPNTNFGQILMTMKNSLDTILLITNDPLAQTNLKAKSTALQIVDQNFKSITDKVMQYMFGKNYYTKFFTYDDNFNILARKGIMQKMRADNRNIYNNPHFAPTLYILGKYYRSERQQEFLKFFVDSANDEYGPSMYYLCTYKQSDSFKLPIIEKSRDKWCKMGHSELLALGMQTHEQIRIKNYDFPPIDTDAVAKRQDAAGKTAVKTAIKAEAGIAAKADGAAAAKIEAAVKVEADIDAKANAEAAAKADAAAKAEAEAAVKAKAEAEAVAKADVEADVNKTTPAEQERKKQSINNICIPNPNGNYNSLEDCNKQK
jgi:hypothetical protein